MKKKTSPPISLRYRGLRAVIRLMLELYYKSIEVYAKNFLPRRGRTLFIANHQAGLVDGLLILGTNKIVVRTLIKHTLWENPVIGFFASGLGMIPVFRRQDYKEDDPALKDTSRHEKTFARVEQTFVEGDSVLIFPEGKSHDSPHLLKLKSGAARMLLQSEAHNDFRLGLTWLPVSLDFEVKDSPGSRVLLHYHPPRRVDKYQEMYRTDPEAAINALKTEMEDYLSEITINFRTWDERLFIERLTEVWLAQAPANLMLDRHNQLLKWKRVFEQTEPQNPQEWQRLRSLIQGLFMTFERIGILPFEIFRKPQKRERFALARLFSRLLLWSPPILAGTILWWIPTKVIRNATIKGAGAARDIVTAYHLVAACIVYPVWLFILWSAALTMLDGRNSLGVIVIAVCAGISSFVVPRRLRQDLRAAMNLYRYGSLQKAIDESREHIFEIWRIAAHLWNSSLRLQILIEDVSSKNENAVTPASSESASNN